MDLKRTTGEVQDLVNKQVARQSAALLKQSGTLSAGMMDRVARLMDKIDQRQVELISRVAPRPKPRRGRQLMLLLAGAGLGYLVAHFMDPDRGRARREGVAKQVRDAGRSVTHNAQRTVIMAGDRAAEIKSMVKGPDNRDPDDLTLVDRVESELFADPAVPKGKLNINAIDGRVILRGEVPSDQVSSLEAAVRKIVGVRDVENLLHTPGTPAPNKAAARSAGNGA